MEELLLNLNIQLELLSFANECIHTARSASYSEGDLQSKAVDYALSILELIKKGQSHATN
jgi:hypothetical protein